MDDIVRAEVLDPNAPTGTWYKVRQFRRSIANSQRRGEPGMIGGPSP
jgi:hypothetical protein